MSNNRYQYKQVLGKIKKKRLNNEAANSGKGNKRQKKVIDSIVVQRVNSQPTGTQKKFQPLDARDFVDFSSFDSLTLENIKGACEQFYQAPNGSCDVLYTDKTPLYS